MSTDLIARLEEQNAKYWRVRTRVIETQKKLKESSFLAKRKTRQITNKLIQAGVLTKMPCEVCGYSNTQTHHLDYTDPKDVLFLCKKHHLAWHKEHAIH